MTTLRRAQIRRGVVGIDTTVKSAHGLWRAFAPTWDMVLGVKRGTLSEAEYTVQYEAILSRVPAAVWDALAAEPEQLLLCFCRDGWFCHTHLLISWAVRHDPARFRDGRA
jgi:hypothetical protein